MPLMFWISILKFVAVLIQILEHFVYYHADWLIYFVLIVLIVLNILAELCY